MRNLVCAVSAIGAAIVTACGTSSSTPVSPAASTSAPSAVASASPPSSSSSSGASANTPSPAPASAAVFTACPAGLTPTTGVPPASENGTLGACAAAAIVYPASGFACRPPSGSTYVASASCPFAPPVAQRLDNYHSGPGGGADPLCRCQNTYEPPSYAVEKSPDPTQPTTYIVRVTLPFGTTHVSLDVQVEAVQSGSLVEDIRCAGRDASTSILAAAPASC